MKKLRDVFNAEIRIPGSLGRAAELLVTGACRALVRSSRALARAAAFAGRVMLKPLKWGLCAVVALAVLAVLAGSILNLIGGRRYAAELQKLKDSGEPYTLADLAGPPVPDNTNGAVIYQRLFKRLPKNGSPKDVSVWFQKPQKLMTSSDWENARRAAAEFDWVVRMVEEAAAKPECKFPVRWQDGVSAETSHLLPLRQVSRVLAAKAIIDAHDGKTASAVRCVQAGLLAADAVRNEPAIISLLLRIAQLDTACTALREVLQEANLSTSQAKTLYDRLSKVDLRSHAVLSAKGERGFGLLIFAEPQKTGLGGGAGILKAIHWRPLLYFDALAHLRLTQRQIEYASRPYWEIKDEVSEDALLKDVPKWCVFTRILSPVYGRILAGVNRAVAKCALGQAALLASAYKNNYGAYPATLADASSALGWKIPEDPFSGRSLVYKLRGIGFAVHSIGPDLKDDGGAPPSKNSDAAGDIVWSVNR